MWPKSNADLGPKATDDPEIKGDVTANFIQTEERNPISRLIKHYSTLDKLKRAVAWYLKLKILLLQLSKKRKHLHREIETQKTDPQRRRILVEAKMTVLKGSGAQQLTLEDSTKAEMAVIHFCQRDSFRKEIDCLQGGSSHVQRDNSIYRLDPKLDQNVLRVGGRLSKSALPEEAKHPTILPKNHHVSKLILHSIHQQVGHSGRTHMLSRLREKYWIPCANSMARKTISECVICRRLNASVTEQKMADLPKDRITPDQPPFTQIGVDMESSLPVSVAEQSILKWPTLSTLTLVSMLSDVSSQEGAK